MAKKREKNFANTTSSTKNFNKCAKISQHCPKMDRQTAIDCRGSRESLTDGRTSRQQYQVDYCLSWRGINADFFDSEVEKSL